MIKKLLHQNEKADSGSTLKKKKNPTKQDWALYVLKWLKREK